MAKLSLSVQLKKDSGASLGSTINSGDHTSFTAAKAAVQAEITARRAVADAAAADLEAADAAFNS